MLTTHEMNLATTSCWRAPARREHAISIGAEGTLDLHEAAKGRGIGDCWASHDWTWSGDRLALVSASESDCRLFEAGGLMVELCRAQVK